MTSRRRWVWGAGLGALALGAGLTLQRYRTAPARHPLYASMFARPNGGELVVADFLGRPLLLNFWGTWCPPCVREMPLLDSFQRRQGTDGWQVLALAVDSPGPVREFLRRQPVGFAVAMAGFEGIALTRGLGNDGGGLPFSALFDADGNLRGTHLGELDAATLQRKTQEIF